MKHKLTEAGPGRPKGCKNKTTSAWDSMANVYETLGGDRAMVEWVKANKLNERIFYQAFMSKAKTEIGLDVTGSIGLRFDYDNASNKD
jgi:hypothetical protein